MVKERIYLSIYFILLTFYLWTLIFKFNIVFTPVIALGTGILIRKIFPGKYIRIYCLLFPVIPGFAFLEARSIPLNYLLLPLILLTGIFFGEIIFGGKRAGKILRTINIPYFYLLLIIFISFVFLILRWSNLTISITAFFRNTPVNPGERISFAIIFPLIYVCLFFFSYLFRLYIEEEDKEQLILYFLSGHGISIFVLILQKYFLFRMFLGHSKHNGLSPDASSMGFLNSISLLLAFYLIVKYKNKRYGYFFFGISILGIINSSTRTALIPILLIIIYTFFKLNFKKKILLILFIILLFVNLFYFYYGSDFNNKLSFVKEVENTFLNVLDYVSGGHRKKDLTSIFSKRALLWNYSVDIVRKYPFTGVGTGNFVFYVAYSNWGKNFYHDLPGSQYFFFSSSIGLIGLLFFILFIFSIMRNKSRTVKYMLLCILLLFLFGNYLWISVCFLSFWLVSSLGEQESRIGKKSVGKLAASFYLILTGIFILTNIIYFNDLHPKTWAEETGTDYDYGFWYKEKNIEGEEFKWTKGVSGRYIKLNMSGYSKEIKIVCGAPLEIMKDNKQIVNIYWKGKLYRTIIFHENTNVTFKIKGKTGEKGFIKLVTIPVFNLKKLKISPESRDLGVQYY